MSNDRQHLSRLYCFEWDKTFTDNNRELTMSALLPDLDYPQAYIYGYTAAQQIPQELNPQDHFPRTLKIWAERVIAELSYKNQIKSMIETIYAHGIKIAIVTFNKHPDLIFAVLKQLEIHETILKSMVIIFGGNSENHKNLHLAGAMEYFNIFRKKDILFIDYSHPNIQGAEAKGYNCLQIYENKEWIEMIMNFLHESEIIESTESIPYISLQKIISLNKEFMNPEFVLYANTKVASKVLEDKADNDDYDGDDEDDDEDYEEDYHSLSTDIDDATPSDEEVRFIAKRSRPEEIDPAAKESISGESDSKESELEELVCIGKAYEASCASPDGSDM